MVKQELNSPKLDLEQLYRTKPLSRRRIAKLAVVAATFGTGLSGCGQPNQALVDTMKKASDNQRDSTNNFFESWQREIIALKGIQVPKPRLALPASSMPTQVALGEAVPTAVSQEMNLSEQFVTAQFDKLQNDFSDNRGVDYDGAYGVQCVDAAKIWLEQYLGIPIAAFYNTYPVSAYEAFKQGIPSIFASAQGTTSEGRPYATKIIEGSPKDIRRGDIVILGTALGHVGMFEKHNEEDGTIILFDQNGGGNNEGFMFHAFDQSIFIGAIRPIVS